MIKNGWNMREGFEPRFKRRATAMIAAFVLTVVLAACGSGGGASGELLETGTVEEGLSVVATIFAPYDFAREIAGDNFRVTMLLPPGADSHSYEPTPRDIITIQNCDVFIYVGGASDTWVDGVLGTMDTSGIKIVTLMDCVEAVREEIVEGMEHSHEDSHGHSHGSDHEGNSENNHEPYDEHVWTYPGNAALIVKKICDAFCEADSANSGMYRENTEAYIQKLDSLDRLFRQAVENGVLKTIVFGDRFPFRYFVDAYGLKYFAAFPGCAEQTEPSARTIAFLIDKVKEEGIPVVFHGELSSKQTANSISEATGAEVMLMHACHNISKEDFQGGASYLSLMEENVKALKAALK